MKKEINKQINEILESVTEAQKVRYNNEELKYEYLKELRDKLDKLYRLGYKDFNQQEIQIINNLIILLVMESMIGCMIFIMKLIVI